MSKDFISLRGRGWACVGTCVAVIRLRDRPGYAVGVQDRFRTGGTGAVWQHLTPARRRAKYLANLHSLPVVESI